MKIIVFFKKSRLARIGGFICFCCLMVMISALLLDSLPESALNLNLASVLDWVAIISGASAAVGAGILAFAALKVKFSTANSVFIVLFSFEIIGLIAGVIIYFISLNPQNTLFPMSNIMSFFYFFLGVLISTVSLICTIATSVSFALYHILRKIIRLAKAKKITRSDHSCV